MKKEKMFLVFIIIIASFFRLYSLASVPPSASLDEVSIGWNALSILQTGRDEYGNPFPILLRAYDDWRPALYLYFVLPFIKLFGLSAFSVRLPSVILSIVSVLAVYFLVKEFFKKNTSNLFNPEKIALMTAFLLSISPWHIYISRLGHEVNIGLSFLILAVLFFLKNKIYLSALFFSLSFISYQSEKIFIPIFLLGIFILYKKEIFSMRKIIIIASILSLIFLAPFLKATLEPNALIRFSGTNIFKANEGRYIEQSMKLQKATEEGDLLGKIIHNRRLVSLGLISEGYLSHFNPVWIFTNPSSGLHKVPGLGLMYLWELPFVLAGIYLLLRSKLDKKIKWLIFLWFLISPISASFTTDSPHALRTIVSIPTWQLFSAIGLISFLNFFKNSRVPRYILTVVILFGILYLFKQYFQIFPTYQSASFQYSLSRVIPYVTQVEDSYNKIIFANNDALFQSYMFYLFYSKYDPSLYQNRGGTVSGGYSASHKIGKYEFRNVDVNTESEKKNLFVINYHELKQAKKINLKVLKIFREINGDPKIAIVVIK